MRFSTIILVKSINVNGHKSCLVCVGTGWVVWRGKEDLPDELIIFRTYHIIAQYYQFLLLGLEGYKKAMKWMDKARLLRKDLKEIRKLEIVSTRRGLPLVVFSLINKNKGKASVLPEALQKFGWKVPAYTLPIDGHDEAVHRVVFREDFGRALVEKFLSHIVLALKELGDNIGASKT
uniref:Uncharacterized protein n=1 Tax=Ananas comosus var. bracteatus TaxID=296719 RepID=A0A6V7P5Q6_ANACO|nr:unnamed protein product [Ananas comosus var. bracteatus]